MQTIDRAAVENRQMATYQFDGSFGGALASDSPTYVERQADADLKQCLQDGKFCYILNARQMGKSSLKARTIHNLKLQGTACVDIDLTGLGTDGVNAEQFYYSIADEIASKIQLPNEVDEADLRRDLQSELETCWDRYSQFSEVKRFTKFIDTVILERIDSKIVIFVDEIDKVISLDSFTDDFFGTIRYFAEQGIENPKYQRLSFVLIGVATPTELMKNKERTPLNIGKAIDLRGFDFDTDNLLPLQNRLINVVDNPESIIKRILFWTGGQPFLTQKLCQLIAESKDTGEDPKITVDSIVQSKIINNWEQQDSPQHLRTIQDRLLNRKDLEIRLLWIYRNILVNKKGTRVDSSNEQIELRISGLLVNDNGNVRVFNEIYKTVFNSDWIDAKLEELEVPSIRKMSAWEKSKGKDKSQLLSREDLIKARTWATNRNPSSNYLDYLNTCQLRLDAKKYSQAVIPLITFVVGGAIWGYFSYDKYASCSVDRGIVGEKFENTCFRPIMTSGEKLALTSSDNSYLKDGVEAFNKSNFEKAKDLFEKSKYSDITDPTAKIFYNNAEARIRKNSLKIAVVVPIDYNETAAIDMLRGAADAQTKFNESKDRANKRLLEIVIVNDANDPKVAKKISEDLVEEQDILAIVGHQFSGSTQAALPQYEKNKMLVVSPTSTSSRINEGQSFRRTIVSTKNIASDYVEYFKTHKLNKIAVINFTNSSKNEDPKNADYPASFYNDFKEATGKSKGSVIITNEGKQNDDYKEMKSIQDFIAAIFADESKPKPQGILIISSGATNAKATALAKGLVEEKENRKIKIFLTHPIWDREILDKIKKDEKEVPMNIIFPCKVETEYRQQFKTTWNQNDLYWRSAYTYDATQTVIKAIEEVEKSSNYPTRAEIRQHKNIQLKLEELSGFPLYDSRNNKHPICVNTIDKGQWVEKPDSIDK